MKKAFVLWSVALICCAEVAAENCVKLPGHGEVRLEV